MCVNRGTCTYICMSINAVANRIIYSYTCDIKLSCKSYATSGSPPSLQWKILSVHLIGLVTKSNLLWQGMQVINADISKCNIHIQKW